MTIPRHVFRTEEVVKLCACSQSAEAKHILLQHCTTVHLCRCDIMAVTIESHIALVVGKNKWKVNPDLIIKIDQRQFLKLPAHNVSLIRIIFDIKNPKDISLSNSTGFLELKDIRNTAQKNAFAEASGHNAAAALFDDGDAPPKARKAKVNQATQNQLRGTEIMEILVPGTGGAGVTVSVIRPVHPLEDLAVELLEPSLTAVFQFIRERDDHVPPTASKRKYTKNTTEGNSVWSMGNGRTATVAKGERRFTYLPASTEAKEGCGDEQSAANIPHEDNEAQGGCGDDHVDANSPHEDDDNEKGEGAGLEGASDE